MNRCLDMTDSQLDVFIAARSDSSSELSKKEAAMDWSENTLELDAGPYPFL